MKKQPISVRHALTALAALLFAAVPLAADPVAELLGKVTAEAYPDADYVTVFDSTRTEVEESGLSHVTRHVLTKILTEKGATGHASMRFDYDPASNMIEIRDLLVRRRDGTVDTVGQESILDLPQPQRMIYWGARMKLAGLTGLEPGDAVEYRIYTKGFMIAYLEEETTPPSGEGTGEAVPIITNPTWSSEKTPAAGSGDGGVPEDESKYIPPMRGHFYDVVLFEARHPIVEKIYTLVLPRDKPVNSKVYHGELSSSTSFDEGRLVYTWWKRNIPAYEREPRMVAPTDAVTKLVLATVPDWEAKSRWFWEVNEPQFESNEEIRAKVEELTRGLDTDDEKREALLRWVARHIRYSGISMGEGEGYTLHSGIMTYNDRAGVCKDIASMLVTMFRAAGYTTYPAMTMAGAAVERVPADQFNHCVVAVRLEDGSYKLYDPTWCPFSREIWSSAEQEQNYVIGSPEGEDLDITPPVPPEENYVKIRAKNRIDDDGNLTGELFIRAKGYSETNLRWGVVYDAKAEMRANFEKWLASASPRARLTELVTTDPVDLDEPFAVTFAYEIPGYAVATDDHLVVRPLLANYIIENGRLNDYRSAVEGEERTHDIFLRCTRQFDFREETELPKDFRLITRPEPGSADSPAAAFEAEVTQDGRKLVFRQELLLKKKVIPASEYEGFKEAVDLSKELADLNLVFAKKGR